MSVPEGFQALFPGIPTPLVSHPETPRPHPKPTRSPLSTAPSDTLNLHQLHRRPLFWTPSFNTYTPPKSTEASMLPSSLE